MLCSYNMSDNLELDSNNLCIAEDAFERFQLQAVSMYQEPEYITLAAADPTIDTVSAPNDFCDLEFDNEVIVGTEDEINTNLCESTEDPCPSENRNLSNLDTSVTDVHFEHDDISPNNETKSRKKHVRTINEDSAIDSINCAIIGSKPSQDPKGESLIKQSSKAPRKRPQKTKPKSSFETLPEVSDTPLTAFSSDPQNNDNKRLRTRPKRLSSSNVHLYSMSYSSDSDTNGSHYLSKSVKVKKHTKKSRSRKKSLASNHESEVQQDEEAGKLTELCKTLELNPVKIKTYSNRKSTSKINILSDIKLSENEDLDNMSLSQMKKIPVPSHTDENNMCESNKTHNSTNGNKHTEVDSPLQIHNKSTEKSKGRRRGRPKKESDSTPEKSFSEVKSIATNDIVQTTKRENNKNISDMVNKVTKTVYSTSVSNTASQTNTTHENIISEGCNASIDVIGASSKRNTKVPIISDFEYNIDGVIDKVVTVNQNNTNDIDNGLLIEDTSKRPVRKKVPLLRYDEESDDDPFANMEVSDDDEPRSRKGKRYYSDDEYVPGKREYKDINSTDSEATELIDEAKIQRKKRIRSKKSDSQSPRKKNNYDKQDKESDIDIEDIEMALQCSDDTQPSKSWGSSNEFENFLAKKTQGTNLKITKVSSTDPTETRTLEIPMIDPEARKTIEMCTQTNILKMVSTGIQTTPPYDIPMKENIALTAEQSENACEFLSGIVKTTSELGILMTQKSEDFITKKITTTHVNDTMKVDYCVKKSFLLFKLAKHNLMQMEEDLAKQYEDFLKANNLTSCREAQKVIMSTPNEISSDSDCEIVETPVEVRVEKPEEKPKFNPKTVFLNKELSIKIAKKPTENKTLDIKGPHAIWINDTVMVKKIPPTQSFLAQDSRNKKPPDNKITTKMVSDFFKSYNRQQVLSTCAPFVTTDWLNVDKECVCNYFVVKLHKFNNNINYAENSGISMNSTASNTRASARNNDFNNDKNISKCNIVTSPETLFKMCYRKVRNQLHDHSHVKEVCQQIQNELTDGKEEPVTLLQLSLRALAEDITGSSPQPSQTIPSDETSQSSALPLKTLCYQKVVDLLNDTTQKDSRGAHHSGEMRLSTVALNGLLPTSPANYLSHTNNSKNGIKSLLSLCVEFMQRNQVHDTKNISILVPKTLKSLTFKSVERLLYGDFKQNHILSSQLSLSYCHHDDEITTPGLTINSVNTLSEEAFLNLEQSHADVDSSEYFDDFDHEDHYESEFNEIEDNIQAETNWVSQVQLKELRSCVNTNPSGVIEEENVLLHTQIKLEPIDDMLENVDGTAFVKIEPGPGLDEMTMLPNIKPDVDEPAIVGPIVRRHSASYDVDEFEEFVTSNKLMSGLHGDDIYSQSALRVRRQHEPDYYEEVDTSMSLLIPQTYEPLAVNNAKGSLMESSSDEDSSKTKKVIGKKKADKRSKGKNKKLEQQKPISKEISAQTKEKPSNIEVANLTKKMRDRIRQEGKSDDSTDSDDDDLSRRLRRRKDQESQAHTSKTRESEIQCSNVDSTDKVDDDLDTFTGFTAIDQNEISIYQKYMKYVYEKILPKDETIPELKRNTAALRSQDSSSNVIEVFNPNEPVELLECEPTMPIFDDVDGEQNENEVIYKKMSDIPHNMGRPSLFKERHGWHCYPLNPEDTKLYLNTHVVLEKLPESFVRTYFEYQGISMNKTDAEIDRLTNLNSLKRIAQVKDSKSKKSRKDATNVIKSEPGSCPDSPSHSDHYDELEPSDDEVPRVQDEVAPPAAQRQTENALAKNLLMDDNNSDADEPLIKKEPLDDDIKKSKSNSKSKKTEVELEGDNLMLTADKMMNKELNLLHAPVLPDEVKDTPSKGPVTRNKHKIAPKNQSSGSKVKGDEDSSSEEEKQWVTTKEKLLKRLCKKEDQGLDDAKRAKLVNEFIERRADCPDSHQRSRHKSKRFSKKYLERQKQLRVLSKELFGEPDPSTSKRSQKAQASLLYKGRRNIRKVIDKKSLARSTVMANMEEFERKRRLNARQAALRERLGCEEGVNVLVINDEVCLEYDFEANRPIVTVHSFFTKVMKAHQYEGVKFMWDACFESLSELEAGRGGGGCILAHCMGLGKTLQVLALLHTVLTHPRVGIKRVLVVCPLSTVLNWVDEIHKWIGPVTNKIKVFELSKLKKTYERAYQLEDWYNGGGIFIIGYELFRSLSTLDPFLDDIRPTIINKIRTALLDPGPDIIVCDEGHLLKNDCSVLSVAMSRVVTKRRIILTGTPMQNNLREYYCMVNFVKPNLLGTYAEYSNRFENPIMNGQHRDSREEDIKLMKARTHILHKVLEGCLQRQEASVLYPYLPKKHEYTLFITQTKCQWELYKHYLHHYGNQSKQSILKDFHILQKIWSHPQVLHNFQTKAQDRRNKIKAEKLEDDLATEDLEEIKPNPTDLWWLEYLDGGNMLETLDSSNKFVVVFRILNECTSLGDKVLIFSTSLFCLDALEYFLKKINKWSLGQEYYRLDGSVPAEVRQKWCREFNADNNYKTKLFLVSTRAGCLGLNMTAANRVIIMDTSWNPAHDIQSIFRVYRFGQKKDCFIYRLVAMGTMEQKIYERSVTKQAVACRVVDEQQIDRHYNMADLTELYKFDELGSSVAGGVAVGVADVALLRVARLPALHAVHEHDSLLRDSSEQGLPEHERNAAWMQFQQEQAHKQIENKLFQEVPNTSMKRLHGHDYALSPAPPDIKTEVKSEDFQPSEPKPKKGKKIIKCCIPIQDDKNIEIVTENKEDEAIPATTSTSMERHASPEPGTSKENEGHKDQHEEVMVEKITDILLKHNFQNKTGRSEIAKLVSKVRNMVAKGYIDNEDTADELTASIANILLPKRVSVPSATDIICESINNSAAPCYKTNSPVAAPPVKPKCGPASKKNVTSQPDMSLKTEPDVRTKRRAAIQAEKHIDSLVQGVVIDLDDDDNDPGDVDFVPDVVEKLQNINSKSQKKTSKNGTFLENVDSDDSSTLSANSLTSSTYDDSISSFTNSLKTKNNNVNKPNISAIKHIKTKDQSSKPVANKDRLNQTKQKTNEKSRPLTVEASDCSILLSDEEEPKTSSKPQKKPVEKNEEETKTSNKPQKKAVEKNKEEPKTSNKPQKKAAETKKAMESLAESNEIVPLPISLLKNQNFINIVAHTYLVGNPMLDEDAANLAAQYSTLKAFNEAKRTGKDVCSGPIYDIAVKVIGKDILKKMRTLNDKADTATADAASACTEMNKRLMTSQQPETPGQSYKDATGYARALRDDLINGKLGTNAVVKEKETRVDVSPSPIAGSVVPVGLIQSVNITASNSFGQYGGECILPDSQNITNDQQLSAAPTVSTQALKRLPYAQTKKSVILKHVVLNKQLVEDTKNTNSLKTFRQIMPKVDTPATKDSKPANAPTSVATTPAPAPVIEDTPDNTICLDSDDEETVTPTQPIPRPATAITQVTSSASNITPTQNTSNIQAKTMPVPVSLTMANAPGVTLPLATLQNLAPPVAKPMPSQQKLILKQVTAGNGLQSKFVLVPTDQLPLPSKSTSSTPVQPIQPQSVNSLLQPQGSTLKTLKIEISKLNPAPCKPGDILKITKSGKIAVLQKKDNNNKAQSKKLAVATALNSIDLTDKPVAPTTSKPAAQKPGSTVTINLTDEVFTSPTKASMDNENQKKKGAPKVALRSSESTNSSSDDSLSIFKDVVQIQASDYSLPLTESRPNSKKKSNVVRTEKTYNSNMYVQHIVSTDKYPTTTIKTVDGKKLTQVPYNKVPKHIDEAVKIKIEGSNKQQPASKQNQQKSKEENNRKGISSIKQTQSALGRTPEKKGSSRQACSSAATVTVDLTTQPVPYLSAITTTRGDATKRLSSTIDKTTAKKKKSEPMTLKDFDLDDIDDIIELE